jgi:hypothetical protein
MRLDRKATPDFCLMRMHSTFKPPKVGWTCNSLESTDELAKVAPESRVHPDALETLWKALATGSKWEGLLSLTEAITKDAPERASGWIMKSLALRGLDRIQEAFDVLLPIANAFPPVPAIAYDLACYACRLRRLDEAWQWLEKACQADGTERFQVLALSDLDLQPLWPRLQARRPSGASAD